MKWPQRQLTWALTLYFVSVFWSADMRTQCLSSSDLACCMCREHTFCDCVLVNKLLCESQKHCVVCLRSYEQTSCMCHEHAVFVFLSTDLLYVSQKHSLFLCSNQLTGCVGHEHAVLSICVLINWPTVWAISTRCCVSLSTDLLCRSWTHCVVCLYQLTCCVGHEHSVLCVLINWLAV